MRDIPYTNQTDTTDDAFLSELDLRGRLTPQSVGLHFRTRKSPRWSYYSHGSPWHQTDAPGSVIEKAVALLQGRFRNSWPPHQFLDLAKPDGSIDFTRGLAIARTSLSRATWLTELSTAYSLTGRLDFARRAIDLLRSFVQTCPFVLDPRFAEDHDTYFGGDADSTQLTSYRLFRLTDFLHSPAAHAVCTDEDFFWLVKQIWFYSTQFCRLIGDPLRRDNHHLLDHGHVPFVIAVAFPEFKRSREMLRKGARVIRHHLGHNLLPDGAYAEHSTNYQYHVLFHFAHPHGVAVANGFKLFTPRQVNLLRQWVEFSARAGKPDGLLPSIGDEPGRPLHHLFGSLATPLLNAPLRAMARGVGCTPGTHQHVSAAEMHKSKDIRDGLSEYYTDPPSKPDARRLPYPATHQYPQGGYTFFRSSWSPSADYLSLSHFSGDYGGHAHWDMLSFTLHTQGKTLIGDPASWLYVDPRFYGHGGDHRKDRPELSLPYRGYSYSVNAHNCLVINDDTLKPLQAMNHGTFWGGWPPKHTVGLFHAGGPIELAELESDAHYPTRHRRFVAHVVGVGFVLVDLLSARPNLAPHQYTQSFHFEGDVAVTPDDPAPGSALRASSGNSRCLIVPGSETESHWRLFRDAYLDNVYGVSNANGSPWIAELTRRIRGQAVFTHFLLTNQAASNPDTRAQYLGTKPAEWLDWQHEGTSANSLDLGPAGRLLVASSPYGHPVDSPELGTDAELAIVHTDRKGKVRSWALAKGGRLRVNGRKLAAGKHLDWRVG